MSVIVEDSSGDIWLYCKGADSTVLPLIVKGKTRKVIAHINDFSMVRYPVFNNRITKDKVKVEIAENIFVFLHGNFEKNFLIYGQKNYSNIFLSYCLIFFIIAIVFYIAEVIRISNFQRGLRTLVVACKKMKQSEYESLIQNIEQARQIIGAERETHITRAYNLMESGLTLLGVTAVEDRLQDKVQETLECLRVAGIKVSSLHRLCANCQRNLLLSASHTSEYRFCFCRSFVDFQNYTLNFTTFQTINLMCLCVFLFQYMILF